jgi:hypothetical protein
MNVDSPEFQAIIARMSSDMLWNVEFPMERAQLELGHRRRPRVAERFL